MATSIIRRKPVPDVAQQSDPLITSNDDPESAASFLSRPESSAHDITGFTQSLNSYHQIVRASPFQSLSSTLIDASPVAGGASTESESLVDQAPTDQGQGGAAVLQENVKWGVNWRKQPTYMVLFLLAGVGIAVAHHVYYQSLNGTPAGNESRQQWARAIGNIFSFLLVAILPAVNGIAYSQYFWVLVRRRDFTLEGLDKIHSLTSDPTSFFSVEVLRKAIVAVCIALGYWCMPLAGVLPPGTLSVVPGSSSYKANVSFPTLHWTSTNWHTHDLYDNPRMMGSESVKLITSQIAAGMKIMEHSPPALNSSYSFEIQGPFVRCEDANSTQLVLFENYSSFLALDSFMFINSTWATTTGTLQGMFGSPPPNWVLPQEQGLEGPVRSRMISLLAFTPLDLLDFFDSRNDISNSELIRNLFDDEPNQLWVQTATESIVCRLGNGTTRAHFEYLDGSLITFYGQIEQWEPYLFDRITMPVGAGPPSVPDSGFDDIFQNYYFIFQEFTNLLYGNLTITDKLIFGLPPINGTYPDREPPVSADSDFSIPSIEYFDTSSRIRSSTGLDACDDFIYSVWIQHPVTTNATNWFWNDNSSDPKGAESNISWETAQLTTPNGTTVEVLFFPTINVYQYNPFYLLISYGMGLLMSLLGLSLGLYSFASNGVVHSTSFSAIVATTRNPDLDALSKGHSLGALPLNKSLAKVKVKFGELVGGDDTHERKGTNSHVAFGIAENVVRLRKGGEYV